MRKNQIQRKNIESSKGKAKKKKQQKKKNHQGNSIKLSADFSAETLQARKEWQDIFTVMKGKTLQARLLYPAKISFSFDGEIKNFTDK